VFECVNHRLMRCPLCRTPSIAPLMFEFALTHLTLRGKSFYDKDAFLLFLTNNPLPHNDEGIVDGSVIDFALPSQLNGNNGEWTNGDDVKKSGIVNKSHTGGVRNSSGIDSGLSQLSDDHTPRSRNSRRREKRKKRDDAEPVEPPPPAPEIKEEVVNVPDPVRSSLGIFDTGAERVERRRNDLFDMLWWFFFAFLPCVSFYVNYCPDVFTPIATLVISFLEYFVIVRPGILYVPSNPFYDWYTVFMYFVQEIFSSGVVEKIHKSTFKSAVEHLAFFYMCGALSLTCREVCRKLSYWYDYWWGQDYGVRHAVEGTEYEGTTFMDGQPRRIHTDETESYPLRRLGFNAVVDVLIYEDVFRFLMCTYGGLTLNDTTQRLLSSVVFQKALTAYAGYDHIVLQNTVCCAYQQMCVRQIRYNQTTGNVGKTTFSYLTPDAL